jgi:flagellar hook-length control protein FliK
MYTMPSELTKLPREATLVDLLSPTETKSSSSSFDALLRSQIVQNDDGRIAFSPEMTRAEERKILNEEMNQRIDEREPIDLNKENNMNSGEPRTDKIDERKETNTERCDSRTGDEKSPEKITEKEDHAVEKSTAEKEEIPVSDEIKKHDAIRDTGFDENTHLAHLQKMLLELLSLIQSLLHTQGEHPLRGDLIDLKDALQQFQESLTHNRGEKKVPLDALRLKSLLTQMKEALKNYDPKEAPGILANLKKALRNALQSSNRQEQTAKRPNAGEMKPLDIDNKVTDKVIAQNVTPSIKKGESQTARNDTADPGFQFSRTHFSTKNINTSGTIERRGGFHEQLQSIIQNARIFIKDSRNGSFSIRLYPESLGRLNINLGLEQGVLYGKFLVENNDAKNLLLDNIVHIKEQLADAGISVGEFQVHVRDEGYKLDHHIKEKTYTLKPVTGDQENQYDINAMKSHDGIIDMVI